MVLVCLEKTTSRSSVKSSKSSLQCYANRLQVALALPQIQFAQIWKIHSPIIGSRCVSLRRRVGNWACRLNNSFAKIQMALARSLWLTCEMNKLRISYLVMQCFKPWIRSSNSRVMVKMFCLCNCNLKIYLYPELNWLKQIWYYHWKLKLASE